MAVTKTISEKQRLADISAAQSAADKATPRPWRDDGSQIQGDYQTRMLVGGEDGDHPTIFIESQCTTADEIEQFEANFELIRRSVNQSAAVDGAKNARLKVPVEFLVDGKRQAFAAGAEAMYNEIIAALKAVTDLKGET